MNSRKSLAFLYGHQFTCAHEATSCCCEHQHKTTSIQEEMLAPGTEAFMKGYA